MSEVLEGGELVNQLSAMHTTNPNVLATRYATDPIKSIWSAEGSILIERQVQIEIMRAQRDLGVDISAEAIERYESQKHNIWLEQIEQIERRTKHDVNARIEAFNDLGTSQDVGIAMTSRDHTENTEQYQKKLSLEAIQKKTVAVIGSFASAAAANKDVAVTGRTHNVPAQMTTLGKRLASVGEEMIDGYEFLTSHIDSLKLRGIKGAVGTQQDILNLFEGDESKVDELDQRLAAALGFNAIYNSVGQIYPRTEDLETIQSLSRVVAPLSNFATSVRLMMGGGLLTESKEKRVGSNAMPHKINPRSSERLVAFYSMLGGYEAMLRQKAGEQWLEGDVSCSAIRRVALPDSFYAADGAMETGLNVVNGFGVFYGAIEEEIDRSLPFLATTKVLTECIKRGVGRADAHETIREHAFDVVKKMREEGQSENDLLERLGEDSTIPMSYKEIVESIQEPLELTGRADEQVENFVRAAEEILEDHPETTDYKGKDIL